MTRFYHIVACDQNFAIGYQGKMPWHVSEDLKHFKNLTRGHCIIMGRKTYESLPRQPLPDRFHIVLTRSPDTSITNSDHEQVILVRSLDEALTCAMQKTTSSDSCAFIIGGAEIYRQTSSMIHGVYITRLNFQADQADSYYPGHILHTMKLKDMRHFDYGSFCLYERSS